MSYVRVLYKQSELFGIDIIENSVYYNCVQLLDDKISIDGFDHIIKILFVNAEKYYSYLNATIKDVLLEYCKKIYNDIESMNESNKLLQKTINKQKKKQKQKNKKIQKQLKNQKRKQKQHNRK